MAYSVLRRYTPPTCTLEIMAKSSLLSRWAGQPILKDLRFKLNLDDPKLPEEQWVSLRGDRSQLEALYEAVTQYVQQLLQTSSTRFRTQFSALGSDEAISVSVADSPTAIESTANSAQVLLQPNGLLSHTLNLGQLATEETGSTVQLSTLQLFDLANALDDYAADVVALPTLERASGLKSRNWAPIAAVALLAVGLSASIVKVLDGSNQTQIAAPTTSQGASSSDQRIATQLPPATVQTSPPATPPAFSDQKLPPPPPPGSTVPISPGLPTIAVTPTAPTAPSSSQATTEIAPAPARSIPNASQRTVAVPEKPTVIAQKPQPKTANSTAARQQSEFSLPAASTSLEAAPAAGIAADQNEASRSESSSAFDTIPQVAEARSYFQGKWQPPEGLDQTLEYTLVVGPNGSIQRIIPLGQAAGDYIDRTGMPLVGESFVSAPPGGHSARIRVVLSPDGKVQTFQE